MIKTTNATISIRITSPPVLRPKARLAIAVREQMPDRIPKITLDMLFRKIPIHWISTIGRSNGNAMHLSINLIIIIEPPSEEVCL
ncbi:MAG: hypothetical protein SPG12_04430 [Eubacteriales bacterium]|nr:hypothetical protein [Eubacteriales bacterium]